MIEGLGEVLVTSWGNGPSWNQLLKSLQVKYKMSILFISHDLSLVKKLVDRVLVMNNGKIVESGDTDKIFRNPNHNYTKGLVFAFSQRWIF